MLGTSISTGNGGVNSVRLSATLPIMPATAKILPLRLNTP